MKQPTRRQTTSKTASKASAEAASSMLEDLGFKRLVQPVPLGTLGLRYNANKPRYDLIPPAAIKVLAEHFNAGSYKYEDRNWEKGLDIGDCMRAALSHITEYNLGYKYDVDPLMPPGYRAHHLIAAVWNLIAAFECERRVIGTDSRPKAQFEINPDDTN